MQVNDVYPFDSINNSLKSLAPTSDQRDSTPPFPDHELAYKDLPSAQAWIASDQHSQTSNYYLRGYCSFPVFPGWQFPV